MVKKTPKPERSVDTLDELRQKATQAQAAYEHEVAAAYLTQALEVTSQIKAQSGSGIRFVVYTCFLPRTTWEFCRRGCRPGSHAGTGCGAGGYSEARRNPGKDCMAVRQSGTGCSIQSGSRRSLCVRARLRPEGTGSGQPADTGCLLCFNLRGSQPGRALFINRIGSLPPERNTQGFG